MFRQLMVRRSVTIGSYRTFLGWKLKCDRKPTLLRPGQEIAVDMERKGLEDVVVLVGMVGGVQVSRWYEPRVIAKDLWWWMTGR